MGKEKVCMYVQSGSCKPTWALSEKNKKTPENPL